MFQFIIGFILGANIGLFLYARILSGAKEDKIIDTILKDKVPKDVDKLF